ncbi:probable fucosyltransferase 7 [Lolium rigidum]|uniref:probable fucosyltransferase 7 n=1 Tax=Lolium rigidum TaxID=89674 RepID=UPI001F5DBDC4|nr:probable fucosyltransferase 7 [Lolium rigidum]
MDVKWARSPRSSADGDDDKRRAPRWGGAVRPSMVLVGFLFTLSLLVLVFGGRWGGSLPSTSPSSSSPSSTTPETTVRHVVDGAGAGTAPPQKTTIPPKNVTAPSAKTLSQDRLLGGLLSAAFDESTCQSRYKSSLYRKPSPFPLSPYLVKKLRKYEARHKKCGPGTKSYRKAVEQLQSGRNVDNSECKYVVWFPCNGLGNRMLTITSTFLYALLSGRVMLVNVHQEQEGLFCEPFPGTSWVLPAGFPEGNPGKLHADAPESYVNMLKHNVIRGDTPAAALPPYVYLHVEQSRLRLSDNIFCDNDQATLGKFTWMILKSDSYFAPALFLTPMYEKELAKMFPQRESTFHHLGRYLFHPTNKVWGIVRRYYEAYLARADEKIGFQIRIFPEKPIKFENMYDQLTRCIREQRLLPELGEPALVNATDNNDGKVKAVLIASLYPGYYDGIRGLYYENPTRTGEVVAVYQPSHEEKQEYTSNQHNQKALAEIYLLSYCDKIAMTAWSTFGYVAYGFAGVKPWILLRPAWDKEVSPVACVRSTSVEPCLHSPPILGCRAKRDVDVAAVKPYVRHCEDVSFGLKLFDN